MPFTILQRQKGTNTCTTAIQCVTQKLLNSLSVLALLNCLKTSNLIQFRNYP